MAKSKISPVENIHSGTGHKPKLFIASLIVLGLSLVIVALLDSAYMQEHNKLLSANQKLASYESDPTEQAHLQTQQLLDKVGQLIVLPTDEQPTIATVTDLSQLKGQAFFADAQVGDKVLIYNNAKKAILYRPSSNKIIELAPLDTSTAAAAGTPAPTNSIAKKKTTTP